MSNINTDDLRTLGDLSRELGWSRPKVLRIVEGVTPAIETGNGRVVFYDKKDVVRSLFEEHKVMLEFMGYLSPDESYDVVTEPDA